MRFVLKTQKNGVAAVHHTAYGETMHPGAGPWAEAMRLYVEGTGLAQLLREPGQGPVMVFDVGLGAAANALAAIACRDGLVREGNAGRTRPLHLVSFESDSEAPRFALDEAEALSYPRGHEQTLRRLLDDGQAPLADGGRWELRLGDFLSRIAEEPARADVFFFDPFSPRVNPEMWRLSTLEALYGCRRRDGPGRLATYSTAFGTRAGLLLAGFFVGEGPRTEGRAARGSTLAAAWLAELAQPLTPAWLSRWRHDRDPWPPLTAPGDHRRLREALAEHPQWAHFDEAARSQRRAEKKREGTGQSNRLREGKPGGQAARGKGGRRGGGRHRRPSR